MKIEKIIGVIKEYDWGNTSFIPRLLGMQEDGKCKAEYWLGTHSSGDATLVNGGQKLSSFLEEHAELWLGKEHIKRFGKQLPLLLKVLAIDKPLSIQCHPTTKQAVAGWIAERELRKKVDSSQWNYKDQNRKAEVLYALSEVTALCGFRSFPEVDGNFKALFPHSYRKYFSLEGEDDSALRQLFTTLYTLDKTSLTECIEEYIHSLQDREELPFASGDGRFLQGKGIALSCYGSYPCDPGLFAPFLLNLVHLDKGQALFLKPDTLHAYVFGEGIELMSASDNVLRGGLTHKKVDVPELLSVLEIEGGECRPCPQIRDEFGRIRVVTDTPEFALYSLGWGEYRILKHPAIELLFCTEGSAMFEKDSERQAILKGECYVVPQSMNGYTLCVDGQLFSATLG
ncbi:MAG: mannose-6-phosphate isomerase, class I [Sphaerochaetaceae bacterium]